MAPSGHGYARPCGALQAWLSGERQPPITKIRAAAALLGIPERDVAQAIAGCDTQKQAINERAQRRNAEACARERTRYANDEAYRKKVNAYNTRKTRGKIAAGKASYRTLVQCGLIPASEQAERRERLRSEGKRREVAGRRAKRVANGHGVSLDGRFASWRTVIKELRALRAGINAEFTRQGQIGARRLAAQCTPEEKAERLRLKWQTATQRRRQRERQAAGDGITRQEWVGVMAAWDYRCAYCGVHRSHIRDKDRRMDLEIEHVVPMPHGPNALRNIVPACKPCNSSKGNRDLLVWAAIRSLYLDPRVIEVYNQNTACAAKT
jgi:5-methylcytosine-specific restriction endonuclease McrA